MVSLQGRPEAVLRETPRNFVREHLARRASYPRHPRMACPRKQCAVPSRERGRQQDETRDSSRSLERTRRKKSTLNRKFIDSSVGEVRNLVIKPLVRRDGQHAGNRLTYVVLARTRDSYDRDTALHQNVKGRRCLRMDDASGIGDVDGAVLSIERTRLDTVLTLRHPRRPACR